MEDTSSQTVAYCLSKSSYLDFEIWKWEVSSHFPSFLFVCFLNSGSHSLRHSGFHFSNCNFKGNPSGCHGRIPKQRVENLLSQEAFTAPDSPASLA